MRPTPGGNRGPSRACTRRAAARGASRGLGARSHWEAPPAGNSAHACAGPAAAGRAGPGPRDPRGDSARQAASSGTAGASGRGESPGAGSGLGCSGPRGPAGRVPGSGACVRMPLPAASSCRLQVSVSPPGCPVQPRPRRPLTLFPGCGRGRGGGSGHPWDPGDIPGAQSAEEALRPGSAAPGKWPGHGGCSGRGQPDPGLQVRPGILRLYEWQQRKSEVAKTDS